MISDVLEQLLLEVRSQLRLAATLGGRRFKRSPLPKPLLDAAGAGTADPKHLGDLLGGLVLLIKFNDPLANQCRISLHAAILLRSVRLTQINRWRYGK